ncbi:iron-sulfur cluster repair di-iron protein [Bradymonas sediminis]|uniref:Iron-sulfur cluster repair di-iron protein n=1 Tax=Bradymonas sediminis TaxID=1548548 RepID=A0A2Z4FLY2_9DELT|nr:iron-sulfur cluster repair di-iron protein [Bradymonas sediminis]AWV89989.1 iron-sulfur cluster repair di-iron protein [Bradymonas sediminis]TDP76055.1 regulator of cell morphogenesis and NO signaling [Bradymonas sediminis]
MSRTTPFDPQQTVASLVLDFSECGPVFKKYHIDFCCKGNISIIDAAAEYGIDYDTLIGDLSQAIETREGKRADDPSKLPATALIAHIISTHHKPLRDSLPFIGELSAKVARVHGENDPRLIEMHEVFEALAASFLEHLDEEEQILFPALMSKSPDPDVLAEEFDNMDEDHLAVGAMLEKLRALSSDYSMPDWACTSYRTLFRELEALEGDTFTHVHLENHALMPQFASA